MNKTPKTKKNNNGNNKTNTLKLIRDIVLLMFWVCFVIIAAQIVVGKLMVLILGEDITEPLPLAFYSIISYLLAMVIIIWLPVMIKNTWSSHRKTTSKQPAPKAKVMSRKELGLNDLPTWTDIGLAPAGFILYLILAAAFMALFSLIPGFDADQTQDIIFNTHIAGVDRMIAFVVLVVVAPIAEEVLFRGWLYTKLKNRLSKETTRIVSVIVTSVLVSIAFGIIHLQWNVGVNVFAMSLVACALREYTGTIYAGILLHMLKNGVAFYMLFVASIM